MRLADLLHTGWLKRVARPDFATFVTAAPVLVAVVMQVALVAAVSHLAISSDYGLWSQHRDRIEARVEALPRQVQTQLVDTAIWDDLARAVARRPVDEQWLANEVAGWFTTYFGYAVEAVVGPDGDLIWVGGPTGTADRPFFDARCPGCLDFAAEVQAMAADPASPIHAFEMDIDVPIDHRPPPPAGYPVLVRTITVGDRPAVVAATPIVPADADRRGPGPYPVLVAVQEYDEAYLARLSRDLSIEGISLAGRDPEFGSVPILDDAGHMIASLKWTEQLPAYDALRTFAPALGIFMAIFTALVGLLAVWLRRASVDTLVGEAMGNHLSHHDTLTGLGNRARLALDLDRAIAALGRETTELALLLLDLDGFKAVNDRHGHPAGDELLREIAARVRRGTPPRARVFRLGGDEFAVLLAGPDAARLEPVAESIIALARQPIAIGSISVGVGCSIGAAVALTAATDPSDLMRAADIALYRAKADGRGCLRRFDPAIDGVVTDPAGGQSTREVHITADPILPLLPRGSGHRFHLDALPRDRSRTVPVEKFIEKAAALAAGDPAAAFTFPVEPRDLMDTEAVDRILLALDTAEIRPDRIALRLLDGRRLAANPLARAALARLKGHGVRLVLPDVGTTHLSIADFRDLPVDMLQLSPGLIRGQDEEAAGVVRAIVALAAVVGADVVADGIDTPAGLALARTCGCSYGMGQLFRSEHTPGDPLIRQAA